MTYFIIKHSQRNIPLRLHTQSGRTVIIPSIGLMDGSELRDHMQKLHDTHGLTATPADIERQVEQRIKGVYDDTPSVNKKRVSGYFTEAERIAAESATQPNKRQL